MRAAGLTQPKLADKIGRSQPWVSQFLFNDGKSGSVVRNLYIYEPDIFDALMEALTPHITQEEVFSLANIPTKSITANGHPVSLEREISVYPAGAGPALEDEAAVTTIKIDERNGGSYPVFGLKIEGDSMTPYLEDGDIAVIAAEPALVRPGNKVAVYIPDEGHVVKVLVSITDEGALLLGSLNPRDGDEQFFKAPAGTVIKGKVIRRIKGP